MLLTRERWQSSRRPAPKAWETRVSRPLRRPPPKKARTLKRLVLMLTAPMASALLGGWPTMTVSTMPMVIQPISARTGGRARRSVGRNSARRFWRRDIGIGIEKSLTDPRVEPERGGNEARDGVTESGWRRRWRG